ncbi:MAG: isopenicillin N synthase family oxygenase [Actinobacteria bacterium]|nr:isopenicillin N synthase family oxygenase [Actinomycetota bacterium]
MNKVPELDIESFRREPTSAAGVRFVDDLLAACHGSGFVYLTGHGIAGDLEARLFDQSRRFFRLPEQQRRDLAIVNSAAFRGYTTLGDELTGGSSDWRDQLDFGPEEPQPALDAMPAWLRLRGPNQWPSTLPDLAPTALAWAAEVERLGLDVIRALAIGLGQPVDRFDSGLVPRSDMHVKIIRYPGRVNSGISEVRSQGVGAHQDTGLLTFILQDDVGGLQVELDSEFVDVPAKPGTYVLNLGEMLQMATSGYLRATRHRVVSPETGKERLSFAFFFNPRFESTFEPVLLPTHLAAEASVDSESSEPIFKLFGENNLKTRLRAHPDVAKRHYGDL